MKSASPWIAYHRPLARASLRLFCFPHAGGSAHLFRTWPEALREEIEVCPVELPGRGLRIRESFFESIEDLAASAAVGMAELFEEPFALFGHSMGALIAFELARILETQQAVSPVALLAAGAVAPPLRRVEAPSWHFPDAEFRQKLREINGTPSELLADDQMMEFLMPMIRADFRAVQTYTYRDGQTLTCPIAAFGGLNDKDVPLEKLKGWQGCTRGSFSYSLFNGDHFFINGCRTELLRRVAEKLAAFAAATRRPATASLR
jgi:medium-chain acyl-[acyl-carrier-protein] hydrolase